MMRSPFPWRFLGAMPFVATAGGIDARAQAGAVTIAEQPVDAVTNVGGVASFKVTATGAPPLAFTWSRNGQVIPGESAALIVLDAVGVNDAGAYQVRVSSGNAIVSSRLAQLVVTPPPAAPIVDPGFRADARLNTTPTAVLPLPGGETIVAPGLDGRVVRLRADGSLDPTFVPGWAEAAFGRSNDVRIDQLISQPDGRLLVAGDFVAFEGHVTPGLVRLNRDGTRDISFMPPADLELINLSSGDVSRRIALQSDGRILVLSSRGLLRLRADGRLDATFAPAGDTQSNVATFAVARDDRIYVGLSREQVVTRLLSDGGEDPAFTRRPADVHPAMSLHVLADGRLIVNGIRVEAARPVNRRVYTLARWLEDGSPDPTFPVLNERLPTAPAPDGALYFADRSILSPDGTRTRLNLGFGQVESPVSTYTFPAVFAPNGRLFLYGGFTFHHGITSPGVVRINRVSLGTREVETPPVILAAWADAPSVTLGEATTLRVAPVAPGPVTYEWRQINIDGSLAMTTRTNRPMFRFAPRYLVERGNWTVRVLNSAGEAVSAPIVVTLLPAELRIAGQPTRLTLTPGRRGTVRVELGAYAEMTSAEWRRDGVVVARYPDTNQQTEYPRAIWNGETMLSLELGPVTTAHAGEYVVTARNGAGATVTSQPITVTVAEMPRFVNLSTRGFVGEGEHAVILGLVVPPWQNLTLMVRGIGPSLARFGVTGALSDARLELFNPGGRRIATNDHWREYGSAPPGAFPLSPDSKDAMLVIGGLPSGAYTVRLSGPPGVTGVGLIELYESADNSDRFVNISTRLYLDAATSPGIAGFAIRGPGPKRVLVRAAGPALAAFGVTPFPNPRLDVRNEQGDAVASNDDWSAAVGADAVVQAARAVGAFPFAEGSKDAALLLDLPAGKYTAAASSAQPGDSGIVLLEVYEVP